MKQKSILICDDDQSSVDACSSLLTHAGYLVNSAHNHSEFFQKLKNEKPPDVILLDVQMPERNGLWIAENLQVLGSHIPIIFLTATQNFLYRLYAPFVGSVAYLIKPVDSNLLLSTIGRVLKQEPIAV